MNEVKTPSRRPHSSIRIRGAREHNLKNLNLEIPKNRISVITGLSGSGKSSLAFDTIYAEGQRRYVESLSTYARQFLEQLKKPDLDVIEGLSPAIAVDQKSVGHNPRSTVGTLTEVSDFLRLLFAKLGVPSCPTHHLPAGGSTPDQIAERIRQWPEGTAISILAPVAQGLKGEFLAEFRKWESKGFVKARVDGQLIELAKAKKLAKKKAHDIDLVVDQLFLQEKTARRFMDSLQTALALAQGKVVVENRQGERKYFSLHSACPECGFSFPEMEPRFFSFNNSRGACPDCKGLGTTDLLELQEYESEGEGFQVLKKVSYQTRDEKKLKEDEEDAEELEFRPCISCKGRRLRPEVLNVRVQGLDIAQVSDLSIEELGQWIAGLRFEAGQKIIAEKIQSQILQRLRYLEEVGVAYLSLSRPSRSLSGGEAQRLRLASQVGSGLIGVLYVMDEPSIGLHPRDHLRLIRILQQIRDKGNTVLLVEHDEETIRQADYVIDLGPRAGRLGGEILAQGTPEEIAQHPNSLTGKFLRGDKKIFLSPRKRQGSGHYLEVLGARGNNLKNVHLKIPLGTFACITGVSGSGKSTLIRDTLYRALSQHFYSSKAPPAEFDRIQGLEHLDKVIEIDQKPIGRTPRSTPATAIGLFPLIRDYFSQLPESRVRGYGPGRFSFNVKGGRCESCQGLGQIRLEMHFLADVFVPCDECQGARYNRETLLVKYQGRSIAEVLQMNVDEALDFFKNVPNLKRKIETLHRVGLDYLSLGQSSTSLSGGEAQRIKLSRELSRRGTGKTLYILDEPTTGLHFEDIRKLVELLHELVDQGNSVLVIEHHVDVMKSSDWIIDLGPEAGPKGGKIVVEGPPQLVAESVESVTAPFLRDR
ncbi:MAG: excinuclease ABC subunit UvrA [Bdellovibrio sp.]